MTKFSINELNFALRYHSRKQIPYNVAARRRTDKYIPYKYSSFKRMMLLTSFKKF